MHDYLQVVESHSDLTDWGGGRLLVETEIPMIRHAQYASSCPPDNFLVKLLQAIYYV